MSSLPEGGAQETGQWLDSHQTPVSLFGQHAAEEDEAYPSFDDTDDDDEVALPCDETAMKLAESLASLQRTMVDGQRRLLVAMTPQVEAARRVESEMVHLRQENRRLQAELQRVIRRSAKDKMSTTMSLLDTTASGDAQHSMLTPGRRSPATSSNRWANLHVDTGLIGEDEVNGAERPATAPARVAKDIWAKVRKKRVLITLPKKLHDGVRLNRVTPDGEVAPLTPAKQLCLAPDNTVTSEALAGTDEQSPSSPVEREAASANCLLPPGECTPGGQSPSFTSVVPESPSHQRAPTAAQSQATFSSKNPLLPDATMTSGAESKAVSSRPLDDFSPDEVVWQWLHRTGFKNYDKAANRKIEMAYRDGESKVRVKSGKTGGTPMEIFFEDMIQYDPISGNTKQVRRRGPHGFGLHIRRFIASCMRRVETGKPRREKFEEYQKRRHELREGLDKSDYDVRDFYWTTGFVPTIARHNLFGFVTMAGVLLNAMWMCVDADLNESQSLATADLHFQVIEHAFCTFFTLEIMIRFTAFEVKSNCLRDGWFTFDLGLVVLMVAEIWVIPLILFFKSGQQSTSLDSLGVLRLFRLLRLTRVARLLRAVPEVMVLLKGISAALRPVLFTLVLLLLLVYVFGVIFKSATETNQEAGEELVKELFPSVGDSMLSLLLHGTLLDNVAQVVKGIKEESGLTLAGVFLLYIFLSSFTVMNMLIGILCDVVSTISQNEKDAAEVAYLKNHLLCILECYDKNGDRSLSREEFDLLMVNPELHECLNRFGTDVNGLKSLADVWFRCAEHLSFQEFLEDVLRLRGEKSASVTDIVELREFVRQRQDSFEAFLAGVLPATMQPALSEKLAAREVLEKEVLHRNSLASMDEAAKSTPAEKSHPSAELS
mmetsp:Transcript_29490/g.67967  ORF Transcript_29490/g.67967 Transcript_29490/m.67967 type:complete len:886 (+) Transcript_29490:89-2746(+)